MGRLQISLVLAVLCATVACTPRDFLTRRLAADLIAGSDTFKSTQQFWLRTGAISNTNYLSPEYLVLQQRGWITGTAAACPPDVAPAPCWEVALTPIGVDVFRDLIPPDARNSQFFSVPAARRQLLEITGLSKDGNTADVDFLWKWIPLNEVGTALYAGGVQYTSTVTFRHYDDGWRVVEGRGSRTSQNLDDALRNADPVQP